MVDAAARIAHRYAAATDLNANDFAALLHIWDETLAGRDVTASQLANQLELTPSAITYLVDRLVERGYLDRVPNPADRRQILLQLSRDGGQISHDFVSPLGEWLGQALTGRTASELVLFTEMLQELTTAMTTLDPKPEAGNPHA